MPARQTIVDSRSPAQIAEAILKVNQTPELRRAGLDALWKLYYAPEHTLTRAELEKDFGVFEDHFGLYCQSVADELGANNPDPLALVDFSEDEDGLAVVTLKESVVTAIRAHAFSK
jgi:hypothetical protein